MASPGNTTIQLYYSTTSGHAPTVANLVSGELGLNAADGKLFFKDANNVVQVIASQAVVNGAGNAIQATFANNVVGGAAGELLYQSAANATAFTAVGTAGQVLLSAGTSSPVWSNGAQQLTTTNFTIKENSGKLYFYYRGNAVLSIDSTGNLTSNTNITAYGTP